MEIQTELLAKNGNVACLLIDRNEYKDESNKLSLVTARSKMVELTVLYGTLSNFGMSHDSLLLRPNDKIYVRSDCLNKPWSKDIMSFNKNDKVKFILVPLTEIVLVERHYPGI